ncbi:DUF1016 domain-containing protein [bacterium]|nr:MAG: DUF1016 domain-containing protein [bacterium]
MRLPDKKYQKLLGDLKEKIRNARQKAALSVNQELLGVYWEIGQAIIAQQKEEGWGTKIIDRLSHDLKMEFPDFKGVSVRNLKYMRAFADAYPDFVQPPAAQKRITKQSKAIVQVPLARSGAISDSSIVQVRLAQLSWYHHITLLDKVKSPIERRFYIEQTILNGWSRDAMVWQIESGLYRRQGKAITNFENTLTKPHSDLAKESLKNPYVFDFLDVGLQMQEKDLEKALIQHVKKFMLELGRGFAYVGNQYNLKVEEDEYFLDLLFYNTKMHSFVVFELKVGEFKPEYAGKLNFYVNTVNEQIKSDDDKPTIGVLLCKTPNETVVRFALKGIDTPLGVADYQLAKAIPGDLQGEMPTIEQLEKELDQEAERLQRPVDKKMDHLKVLMKKLKGPEAKVKRDDKNSAALFTKIVLPLKKKTLAALEKEIIPMFHQYEIQVHIDNTGYRNEAEAKKHVREKQHFYQFRIEIRLNGFKRAGIKAFDCYKDLYFHLKDYHYTIGFSSNGQDTFLTKLYDQHLTHREQEYVIEKTSESILDYVTQQVESITGAKAANG